MTFNKLCCVLDHSEKVRIVAKRYVREGCYPTGEPKEKLYRTQISTMTTAEASRKYGSCDVIVIKPNENGLLSVAVAVMDVYKCLL